VSDARASWLSAASRPDCAWRSASRAAAAFRRADHANQSADAVTIDSTANAARTVHRQRVRERMALGAVTIRCSTPSVTTPSSQAACDSSIQILSEKRSHGSAAGPRVASCSAPPMLIGITGRSGCFRRNSSTSARTQRGSARVPLLAMTTRMRERCSARFSVLSS
jgi:hypothetical protein